MFLSTGFVKSGLVKGIVLKSATVNTCKKTAANLAVLWRPKRPVRNSLNVKLCSKRFEKILTFFNKQNIKSQNRKVNVFSGTTPPNSTQKQNCLDNNDRCASWASAGECRLNPHYMLVQCCMSCKRSNHEIQMSEVPSCVDSNDFCMSWSMNGECARNPAYMKEKCCDSCNKYESLFQLKF